MKFDPFKIRGVGLSLPGLSFVTRNVTKKPYTGITQGGSSRKNRPAKRAATLAAAKAETKET